jgi:hypothetical protein
MPCYCPIPGWRSRSRNESGKRGIVFKMAEGYINEPIDVPCGKCIGCRIGRARQWAVRIMHEASLSETNCFLTLTYNDDVCPEELQLKDLQLFMKRLREKTDFPIRYFAVGEYGEKFTRPHYHIILFGYDFADKKYWSGSGISTQYRSEFLESVWTSGFSTVGTVTTASAQYVSQYCVKIITGKAAKEHYNGKRPEFAVMSRRPGLGKAWLDKYGLAACKRDFVVVAGGAIVPVPRYYMEAQDERIKARAKAKRLKKVNKDEQTGTRLIAKAACAEDKMTKRKRSYENDNERV